MDGLHVVVLRVLDPPQPIAHVRRANQVLQGYPREWETVEEVVLPPDLAEEARAVLWDLRERAAMRRETDR